MGRWCSSQPQRGVFAWGLPSLYLTQRLAIALTLYAATLAPARLAAQSTRQRVVLRLHSQHDAVPTHVCVFLLPSGRQGPPAVARQESLHPLADVDAALQQVRQAGADLNTSIPADLTLQGGICDHLQHPENANPTTPPRFAVLRLRGPEGIEKIAVSHTHLTIELPAARSTRSVEARILPTEYYHDSGAFQIPAAESRDFYGALTLQPRWVARPLSIAAYEVPASLDRERFEIRTTGLKRRISLPPGELSPMQSQAYFVTKRSVELPVDRSGLLEREVTLTVRARPYKGAPRTKGDRPTTLLFARAPKQNSIPPKGQPLILTPTLARLRWELDCLA